MFTAKKRGKRAKLSLSTRGKKRPATEITENGIAYEFNISLLYMII